MIMVAWLDFILTHHCTNHTSQFLILAAQLGHPGGSLWAGIGGGGIKTLVTFVTASGSNSSELTASLSSTVRVSPKTHTALVIVKHTQQNLFTLPD